MLAFLARWAVFVLLNICVGVIATFAVTYGRARPLSLSDTILDWCTCFVATIVLVLTGLGVIGLLSVAFIAFVLLSVAVLAYLLGRSAGRFEDLRRDLHQHLTGLRLPTRSDSVWGILFLLACGATALAIAALAEPSTIVDGFTYHLPMPVDWWKAQRLTLHYLPWSDYSNSYFPGNGHLLYFWMILPFQSSLLVRLVGFAIWFLLGLSFYRLIQQMTGSRRTGLSMTTVFLFVPLVLSQATDLSLDMASMAFYVLAWVYLTRLHRSRDSRTLLLFGVSSGLFLGIKYSAPVYLALLLLAFLWVLLTKWRKSQRPPHKLVFDVGLWCCAVLVFGGYWYFRNIDLTGNPIFPVDVAVGQMSLFRGCYPAGNYRASTLISYLGKVRVYDVLRALVISYGGAYWMVLAVSMGSLLTILRRGGGRGTWRRSAILGNNLLLPLGLILVGSVLLYLWTPYSVMRFTHELVPPTEDELTAGMRFSMVAGAFAFLAAVLVTVPLAERSGVVLPALSVVGFLQGVLSGYDGIRAGFVGSRLFSMPRLLLSASVVLVSLAIGEHLVRSLISQVSVKSSRPRSRASWLIACVAVLVIVLVTGVGLYILSQYREAIEYPVYEREYGLLAEGWEWVARQIHDSKIAVIGYPTFYPLYGRDWSNDVRYVNIEGDIDDLHHDFCLNGGYYRPQECRPEPWMRNLSQWGAEYILFSRLHPSDCCEGRWIGENPEQFKLAFENAELIVYRIDY